MLPLLDMAWETLHPGERHLTRTEVNDPTDKVPTATKLDHILSTDGLIDEDPEWGIEVKRLQFVGDTARTATMWSLRCSRPT